MLLIPPYREALTPGEVQVVRQYISGGGGVIMLGEAGYTPPNEGLTALYGVKQIPMALFGPAPAVSGDIVFTPSGDHPALSGHAPILLNWSQPLSISGAALAAARAPGGVWLDGNDNAEYDEGSDPVADFVVAAAYDEGCGRLAFYGDNAFSSGALAISENGEAMRELLGWAARGRACPTTSSMAPRRVLLDESHDNKLTLDWARAQALANRHGPPAQPGWYYLERLQQLLSAEFQIDQSGGAPLTAELLSQYEVLIISPYADPLSDGEAAAVQRYVASGGGLILLGDCGFDNPNPLLAAAYGLAFNPACLMAPTDDGGSLFMAANYAGQPWLRRVDPLIVAYGQSLELSGDAFPLLDTLGADSWRDTNGNGEVDAGEPGVFEVAAAFDGGCGRVAAAADDEYCDDCLDVLKSSENDVFMRALLRWASAGSACQVSVQGYQVFMPMLKR